MHNHWVKMLANELLPACATGDLFHLDETSAYLAADDAIAYLALAKL